MRRIYYFDGQQFKDSVDLTSSCHHSPRHTFIVFRSSEVRRLLEELDGHVLSFLTTIPKGPPSSTVANCRPISITPVLSECLGLNRLGQFMEFRGVLPKGLGTCDGLL